MSRLRLKNAERASLVDNLAASIPNASLRKLFIMNLSPENR
jgi:hypothetical protein